MNRKSGKFAIKNLTLYLITGYMFGYFLALMDNVRGSNMLGLLTLDPIKICHGQVWRIISWVLIPPTGASGFSGLLFTLLMMYCCFSIGTVLERTWGTVKYNVYILGGIGFTVLAAFINMFVFYFEGTNVGISFSDFILYFDINYSSTWLYFSTYYINMSIYIGFALTFPNNVVRFMFFLPIKMKWLGIIDGIYFVYYLGSGIYYHVKGSFAGLVLASSVAAAMVNILIFWLFNLKRFNIQQAKRRAQFNKAYNAGAAQAARYSQAQSQGQPQGQSVYYQKAPNTNTANMRPKGITKHRCAVCGQTEESNPELEFRFCSKCNGAYEYCQNHLFTHVHKS